MRDGLIKLAEIANRVKTPLSLAGLVIVVLYAIFRQVLGLDIFSKLESDLTFRLLLSVLDKVFWLALIALVLGVLSYLAPLFIGVERAKSSDVKLLNASLDPADSPYVQELKEGVKTVKPRARARRKGKSDDPDRPDSD